MPTLDEVKAAIPERGIVLSDLVNMFKKRVTGKDNTSYFISLVSRAGKQDSVNKLIFPRTDGASLGRKKLIVVLPVALPVVDDKESLAKKKLIVVLPLRSL